MPPRISAPSTNGVFAPGVKFTVPTGIKIGAPAGPPAKKPAAPVKPSKPDFTGLPGDAVNPTVIPAGSFAANTSRSKAAQAARLQAQHDKFVTALRNAILAHNQDVATAQSATKIASAKTGLLPVTSKPFGGGKAKADKYQPDLTAKSRIAEAAKALRASGGLASPADRQVLSKAEDAVAHSQHFTFDQTHGLPAELTRPAVSLKPDKTIPIGAPPAPPEAAPGSQAVNGREAMQEAAQRAQGPLPGWVSGLAGKVEPTFVKALMQSLSTQPGFSIVGLSPQIGKAAADVHANAVPTIGSIPLSVQVASADLTPAGRKLLAQQGARTMSLQELISKYGEGQISVQFRKSLIDQAVKKQGWPGVDVKSWTDADAAARAFTPYRHSLFGFAQNAIADIGSLTAGANIVPMLGGPMIEAAQGNFQPLVRTYAELGQQWKNHLALVGNQSLLENFYQQPFTTFTSNAPIVRGAGELVGKRFMGLEPTREVTLPTASSAGPEVRVTVPQSQNALTHVTLQPLHDRLLRLAQHGDVHAQAEPPAGVNAELGTGALRRAAGAVGQHLETRIIHKHLENAHETSTLKMGTEARHAQEELRRAIVKLPTKAGDLVGKSEKIDKEGAKPGRFTGRRGKVKISSKQTRAEALIDAGRLGVSSPQVVQFFEHQAELTRSEIANQTRLAEEYHAQAKEATDAGHIDQANRLLDKAHEAEAQVRVLPHVLEAQLTHAEYSRAHPVDLNNLHPDEKAVIDAARKVSQATTALKGTEGALGEHGALFGELEGNLRVSAATEPHTEAGQLARQILVEREARMALEKRAKEKGFSNPRSPAAQAALGRLRATSSVLRDVGERIASVEARRQRAAQTIERQSNAPVYHSSHPTRLEAEVHAAAHQTETGHTTTIRERGGRFEVHSKPQPGTAAESAAARAGVAAGTIQRIVQEGRRVLEAKRSKAEIKVNAERRIATEMEQAQRTAHERILNGQILVEQRRLRDWRGRKGIEAERRIPYIESKIKALKSQLEHFQPDERLVAQQAKAARLEAEHATIELNDRELSDITRKHITAAQEKAIGAVNLHDAIHEGQRVGARRELDRLQARLLREQAATEAHHEAVSGTSSYAHERIQEHLQNEMTGMQRFQQLRHDQGVDPFHITLRRPGDKFGNRKTDVSEGRQFPQGNYTHDLHIQVSANLDATMRTAIVKDLFRQVSNSPLVIREPSPGSEIPPGFVLATEEALHNPKSPLYTAAENVDRLGEWEDDVRQPGQLVPTDGKKYVLVAKDAQEWLKSTITPVNQAAEGVPLLGDILKFTNQYRRWMLYSLPRTLVNNAVGNPIMAAIAGAGIMDYIRAVHILRNHPELMRITMKHMGPIHNVLQSQKITGYQAWFRNANTFHEDLGRLTVYIHHAVRQFKRDNGLKFYNRVDMASEEMTRYLKDMAEGKHPDGKKFADFATRWFGNMAKRGKYDSIFSASFLFHKWVGHMIHLTLATMPLKYPGRTALLLNLSHMADDYRKEHGIYPAWAQGVVGLFGETSKISNMAERTIWGLNTGGVNPFATPGQTLNFGSTSDPRNPVMGALYANLNPILSVGLQGLTGTRLDTGLPFKDTKGHTLSPFDWRVLLHQAIGQTPVLSTIFPSAGTADNAFQIPGPWATRAYSAAGLSDPAYYPPSSSFGQPWWKDALLRAAAAAGVSIRPTDSTGPRAKLSASRAAIAVAKNAAQQNK